MTRMEPKEPKDTSRFDGLSFEVVKIIRDPEFQKTVEIFRTNQTIFRVVKGLGFSLALISGLFGYFLKANSEADDRKAAAITNVINEKREWVRRVNAGVMDVRRTRFFIKYDCDHNKPVPLYDQGIKRYLARDRLIESFNGIHEIFDDQVFQTLLNFTAFDETIKDVCDKNAPDDNAWLEIFRKVNQQMKMSIKADRDKLEKLGNGIFSEIL